MTHTQEAAAALQLAELVLNINMATGPGLAAARQLARQALGMSDCTGLPPVTAIVTNGTLRIVPRDEPVFLLRGQDALAAGTVRYYADLLRMRTGDWSAVHAVMAQADLMDAWRPQRLPTIRGGA